MHIHPFLATYPNMDYVTSADYFFGSVKEQYSNYIKSGFYKKTAQEGLYIHRISGKQRSYLGLLACLDIQDYLDGHIKKHENTIAAGEQEQMRLMVSRQAMVKPVMLTYPNAGPIEQILRDYVAEHPHFMEVYFEEVHQTHAFWELSEEATIQLLQQAFLESVPNTYIADGHHRISTTALLFQKNGRKNPENPYRRLLCALYPSTELEIHDFNRIIDGMNELRPSVFMARLSQIFDIELMDAPAKPSRKHELTLFLDREWFRLRWRQHVLDEFANHPVLLDVTLLNEKVLKEILEIKDVRTDDRLKYMEGPKGLKSLRDKAQKIEERIAFCLYPVTMADFLAISDAGGVLPPKSTWFEPRIRSGLIVRQF